MDTCMYRSATHLPVDIESWGIFGRLLEELFEHLIEIKEMLQF